MEQKVFGTVENVVYENSENDFAVIDVEINGELMTAVGSLYGVVAGEQVNLVGEYTSHSKYGNQFKVKAYERILPKGTTAILKYLSSGAIKGIGATTAERLVAKFKDQTLEVIENNPEDVATVKGVTLKKAEAFSKEMKQIKGVSSTVNALSKFGIDLSDSLMLVKIFGFSTVEVISENPYLVCGYPLYKDFAFADCLAEKFAVPPDDEIRIRAAFIYILNHNMKNGHTCVPTDALINKGHQFLNIERDAVEIEFYNSVESGFIITVETEMAELAFLPSIYSKERYIASRINLLSSLNFKQPDEIEKKITQFEKQNEIEYAPLQKDAIEAALTKGSVIITGGPGTGKTTALNAIIKLCELQGEKVFLAAPTGRAAKRLSELTGKDAKTIHRLLEVDGRNSDGDKLAFLRNEENPLRCDVVVVDEMSMVDTALFEALLKGIRPQCRLVMVGDHNQLPSVGAGNVLKDLLQSQICHAVELKTIFRQAAQSLIVVNAHDIVEGKMPDLSVKNNDFFFLGAQKEAVVGLIGDLISTRLPKTYGYNPFEDIQVLCPNRAGFGTEVLNEAIRERINPVSDKKNETRFFGKVFREQDKVMQIKNNYDIEVRRNDGETTLGVFNGDIGYIEKINYESSTVTVNYEDKFVEYSFEQLGELELAYAVTVHKSQGSEFPVVILCLSEVNNRLRYRNILYTAVTRAKTMLIIVGDQNTVEAMVLNNKKTSRFTGLLEFLKENEI